MGQRFGEKKISFLDELQPGSVASYSPNGRFLATIVGDHVVLRSLGERKNAAEDESQEEAEDEGNGEKGLLHAYCWHTTLLACRAEPVKLQWSPCSGYLLARHADQLAAEVFCSLRGRLCFTLRCGEGDRLGQCLWGPYRSNTLLAVDTGLLDLSVWHLSSGSRHPLPLSLKHPDRGVAVSNEHSLVAALCRDRVLDADLLAIVPCCSKGSSLLLSPVMVCPLPRGHSADTVLVSPGASPWLVCFDKSLSSQASLFVVSPSGVLLREIVLADAVASVRWQPISEHPLLALTTKKGLLHLLDPLRAASAPSLSRNMLQLRRKHAAKAAAPVVLVERSLLGEKTFQRDNSALIDTHAASAHIFWSSTGRAMVSVHGIRKNQLVFYQHSSSSSSFSSSSSSSGSRTDDGFRIAHETHLLDGVSSLSFHPFLELAVAVTKSRRGLLLISAASLQFVALPSWCHTEAFTPRSVAWSTSHHGLGSITGTVGKDPSSLRHRFLQFSIS